MITRRPATRRPLFLLAVASALAIGACSATPASPVSDGRSSGRPASISPAPGPPEAAPVATFVPATGEATALAFDEFYDGYDVRTGLKLSEKLRSLDGKRVRIEGYMAPPLKPELDFFVLTRIRLAYCPFCSTAGDWPDDIAVVYLLGDPMRTTERPLRLEGTLELGPETDPETGMLSLVRIQADRVELL